MTSRPPATPPAAPSAAPSDTRAGAPPSARAEPSAGPLGLATAAPEPGLYLLAMPIGAARDITLRALDLLNTADLLAAEDTRTMRHLMAIHGIALRGRRIVAYHEHNEAKAGPDIIAALRRGLSVAYASEAGTPSVSDPGFRLARDAAAAGLAVHAVPGPSAALAALVASGLPSDRFLFAGFAPTAAGARRRWLEDLLAVDATVIIFESPRRVKRLFDDLCEIDPERETVICRELTKKFEDIRRGPARILAASGLDDIRGEVVVLVDRGRLPDRAPNLDALLAGALAGGASVRDAVAEVVRVTGQPRRAVYAKALELGRETGGGADGDADKGGTGHD